MSVFNLIGFAYAGACFAFLVSRSGKAQNNYYLLLISIVFGVIHSYMIVLLYPAAAIFLTWAALGTGMSAQGNGTATMVIASTLVLTVIVIMQLFLLCIFLAVLQLIKGTNFASIVRCALLLTLADAIFLGFATYASMHLDSHPKLWKPLGMEPARHHVGFIDKSGLIVVPANYVFAGDFKQGLAMVREASIDSRLTDICMPLGWNLGESRNLEKCIFIDKLGRKIIDDVTTSADHFSDGLLPVVDKKNSRCKYIDRSGAEVLAPIYSEANDFEDGLATVSLGQGDTAGSSWACIDKRGKIKWKINNIYQMTSLSGGIAKVLPSPDNLENSYFVDKHGKRVGPQALLHTKAQLFESPRRDINRPGWAPIEVSPGHVSFPFSEGLRLAQTVDKNYNPNAKWQFIDKQLHSPFPNNAFLDARSFKDGRAAVTETWRGGWTFIDKHGSAITKQHFESADSFSEGLASVSMSSGNDPYGDRTKLRYGFVDLAGEIKIQPKYIFVRAFSDGLAVVQVD